MESRMAALFTPRVRPSKVALPLSLRPLAVSMPDRNNTRAAVVSVTTKESMLMQIVCVCCAYQSWCSCLSHCVQGGQRAGLDTAHVAMMSQDTSKVDNTTQRACFTKSTDRSRTACTSLPFFPLWNVRAKPRTRTIGSSSLTNASWAEVSSGSRVSCTDASSGLATVLGLVLAPLWGAASAISM